MKKYKADFHIHTVLSPCGDLEMSPVNIIKTAKQKGLDIIGITDHNTTKHCKSALEIGKKENVFVLMGVEITTKEELHCLAFFENLDTLNEIQQWLESKLPDIKNNPDIFGYQVVVNEKEEIIEEEPTLLISAISATLEEVEQKVHHLHGMLIPAHVNKMKDSIYSQLGFLPFDLNADAIEIFAKSDYLTFIASHKELNKYTITKSSDAHYIEDVGSSFTILEMENISFENIKNTLTTPDKVTI